jgi:hypothetical protein
VRVGAHGAKPDIPRVNAHNEDIVRFVTIMAISLTLLGVAACGGSSTQTYSEDDVSDILGPPSASAEGPWKARARTSVSLDELRTQLRAEGRSLGIADALASAGFTRVWEWEWTSRRGSSAGATANLFDDADGARDGFDPLQDITTNWITPVQADELGDQAVAGRSDAGAGYTWRRGNLVLAAFMFRGTGPAFDYVAAARTYAHALDERAKAR